MSYFGDMHVIAVKVLFNEHKNKSHFKNKRSGSSRAVATKK